MRWYAFLICVLLSSPAALAVDNTQTCTGNSCAVKLIPKTSGGANVTAVSAAGTGIVTLGDTSVIGGSSFAGNKIVGGNDGSAIASGYAGQIIETSSGSTRANAAATTTYKLLETLALTPGRWLIYSNIQISRNGATYAGDGDFCINISANSNCTGTTLAKNRISISTITTTNTEQEFHMSFPVNITANTTYNLNAEAQFSAGTPQWSWYAYAERVP